MGRRSEASPSLDGVFCAACGIYNTDSNSCRACGAALSAPVAAERLGFEDPSGEGIDPPPDLLTDAATWPIDDPRDERAASAQLWRRGSEVIARKGAQFTHACVRCGSASGLQVAAGRALGGMELGGDGAKVTSLADLVDGVVRAFKTDAYEVPLALCPRHWGLARWLQSTSKVVSAIAVSSVMQAAPGSGEYRRYRGMARGFRETLPEWEGPFPPRRSA